MTVLRLEHLAEAVANIEMKVAMQEPKKGYDESRKKLDDIYFELSNYRSRNVCTYFFITSAILDRIYKIQNYIREHE